jgi:hypothetical protein
MYVMAKDIINDISFIVKELNYLAQAESYYSFAQNTQREMIYNPEKPILDEDSFQIAKATVEQLYTLN